MRFMVLVPAGEESEAGVLPDDEILDAMTKYNEELAKAGVLLDLNGLHPTSDAVRVKFDEGKTTVMDGPFTEAKELIAGYWLIEVGSKEEAIDWVKRAPFGGGVQIEVRQVFELDEFGSGPAVERAREIEKHLPNR
jgi:hypothetical protein